MLVLVIRIVPNRPAEVTVNLEPGNTSVLIVTGKIDLFVNAKIHTIANANSDFIANQMFFRVFIY